MLQRAKHPAADDAKQLLLNARDAQPGPRGAEPEPRGALQLVLPPRESFSVAPPGVLFGEFCIKQ